MVPRHEGLEWYGYARSIISKGADRALLLSHSARPVPVVPSQVPALGAGRPGGPSNPRSNGKTKTTELFDVSVSVLRTR
jgi:hypothetical protein